MLDVPTTNRNLIQAARDPQNDEAWRQLYRTYRAPIAALCNASGLNPSEADDVVQEVLARLARRLARTALKPGTVGLRSWLSQVTNQQIFDLYRRRRRNALSPAASTLIQSWLPAALAPEVDADAREQLEAHLWAVCLARVRHEVSPTHWQIFESYCLQGVSSPEVARVFGTTQINVRMIRKRVVGRIKEQWKRLAVEPLDIEE